MSTQKEIQRLHGVIRDRNRELADFAALTRRLCAQMLQAGTESSVDPKLWDAVQDALAALQPEDLGRPVPPHGSGCVSVGKAGS